MGGVIRVREPRTGMETDHTTWADWRGCWDRRPMSLRKRVSLCTWCWAFGAIEDTALGPIGVPCLACGRVGPT